MVELEYFETIKYEAGRPKAMFLLADKERMEGKRIAIFGTGLEAFFAFQFLKQKGWEAECFINNDPKLQGNFLCGKRINSPGELWGNNYYIIIAMSKIQYLNEVLWQLKVHKEGEYGIAFIETYHSFAGNKETGTRLQEISIEVTNRLLCENKTIEQIIYPTGNVGPARNIMFLIMELCWTTAWSHHLLQWFYEKYNEKPVVGKTMLEIGPGKGFFSAVVKSINPEIDIEWLMFELEEKSEEAVKGKYKWWPANMFKTYYGVIEEPEYRIHKKFDIIVMTEVMEHFSANPRVTISKIADMLKSDGELYLSTPLGAHLPIYDSYYDIPDFVDVESYKESYIGHSYQYTKKELEQILDECGLQIERYALSDSNNHNLIAKHKAKD